MSQITLPMYSAAIPEKPFAHITLDFPHGSKITDVAKKHMQEVFGGTPIIETVVHDDGRTTRFCFSPNTDYFLSWNLSVYETCTNKPTPKF